MFQKCIATWGDRLPHISDFDIALRPRQSSSVLTVKCSVSIARKLMRLAEKKVQEILLQYKMS
jgi:hypothetical protein